MGHLGSEQNDLSTARRYEPSGTGTLAALMCLVEQQVQAVTTKQKNMVAHLGQVEELYGNRQYFAAEQELKQQDFILVVLITQITSNFIYKTQKNMMVHLGQMEELCLQ